MLAVTLTFSGLFCIMFLILGGVVGWITRTYLYESTPVYAHPEMFDENGNILPDEILAVRFENTNDYYEDEEDDED